MRKPKEKQFWLINTSTKRDVLLADLRIKISKGARINLLSKHYNFTLEQLKESEKSGSIYKKRHLLVVRENEPQKIAHKMIIEVAKTRILTPIRNKEIDNTIPQFAELDFDKNDVLGMSDEQWALEQAEADEIDHAPALAVDKKYTAEKEE